MILYISGLVFLIGLVFLFYDYLSSFGIIMIVISLMFGFGMLGFLIPVRMEICTSKYMFIVKTDRYVLVELDNGKIIKSDKAYIYNADPKNIRIKKEFNSYGVNINNSLVLKSEENNE